MVADAVMVEPISTIKFPANRGKNRDFSILGLFLDRRPSSIQWF